MFSLRYVGPSPDLRDYISSYYLFRADLPRIDDVTRADLPQLRFMLQGRGFYTFGDGRQELCSEAMVTGPTNAATRFTAEGPLWVFGVGFRPAGWSALVGLDAQDVADRVVEARALFGPLVNEALEALREAPTLEGMAAIADRLMRALVDRPRRAPIWFVTLADGWLTGAPSPDVDDLVRASGLSVRQVERLTNRVYGASPKLLARKYRALRAAVRLVERPGDWQEAAGDAFYDQSHFIREFKRFTGLTPRRFGIDPPPVTRLTLDRRKLIRDLPKLNLVS